MTESGSGAAIHRIGGGSVANLRLKPAEAKLDPPGISVFKGGSPEEAAEQIKTAFPNATKLHELAKIVGSTTDKAIRGANFEIIADPTRRFANHHRIIHPAGVVGFADESLAQLAQAFSDTIVEN